MFNLSYFFIIMRQLFYIFFVFIFINSIGFFANADSHLSKDEEVNQARQHIKQAEFEQALIILRPKLADSSRKDITDIRFLFGLSALSVAEANVSAEARDDLLDEAIAAFRQILLNQPDIRRVRLELARAFFSKGDDELAKEHFERVLGSDPPPAMALNIRRFLRAIQSRKRWSGYFSVNIENNDNINSGIETLDVDLRGLPFRFPEENLPRTERGLVFSGGGGYQYPVSEKLRWNFGGDAVRSEYRGSDLDQTFLSIRTGPRWLISPRSEFTSDVFVGQRWQVKERSDREFGVRYRAYYQLTRRIGLNSRGTIRRTVQRHNKDDNSVNVSYSFGGSYMFSPLLQGSLGVGGGENRPRTGSRSHPRNVNIGLGAVLPLGWTVGGNVTWSRTRYKINAPFSSDLQVNRGKSYRVYLLNRGFNLFNFSPQLSVTREMQESNNVLSNYKRTRWNVNLVRQF